MTNTINNFFDQLIRAFSPRAEVELINHRKIDHLFCRAVDKGDLQKAGQLLKEGANIDAFGALMYTQDLKITDWLIKNGADVNAQYGGWTPLHWAAAQNALAKAELLIKNGADVNARGDSNNTPLYEAAAWGQVEVLELLIQCGADVMVKNSLNQTVLHWAAGNDLRGDKSNDKKIIEILIKAGVDINAQDVHGNTVLHYASFPGREEIREFLLEQGADSSILNNNQQTAQDVYCEKANNPIYINDIEQGIGHYLTPDMSREESFHQSENEVLPSGENSSLTFFGDVFNQFC